MARIKREQELGDNPASLAMTMGGELFEFDVKAEIKGTHQTSIFGCTFISPSRKLRDFSSKLRREGVNGYAYREYVADWRTFLFSILDRHAVWLQRSWDVVVTVADHQMNVVIVVGETTEAYHAYLTPEATKDLKLGTPLAFMLHEILATNTLTEEEDFDDDIY